jgi:hypothetical protein
VGHRVAPDLLVDLLPLDDLARDLREQCEQLELTPGETEALAADESLVLVRPDLELGVENWPGVSRTSDASGAARRPDARLTPRDDRAWRSSRPRQAEPANPLADGRLVGADGTPRPDPPQTFEELPTLGPPEMSNSRAFTFMATRSSTGTLPGSTRCFQPEPSRRLPRTVRKALSVSITASRIACACSVILGPPLETGPTPGLSSFSSRRIIGRGAAWDPDRG